MLLREWTNGGFDSLSLDNIDVRRETRKYKMSSRTPRKKATDGTGCERNLKRKWRKRGKKESCWMNEHGAIAIATTRYLNQGEPVSLTWAFSVSWSTREEANFATDMTAVRGLVRTGAFHTWLSSLSCSTRIRNTFQRHGAIPRKKNHSLTHTNKHIGCCGVLISPLWCTLIHTIFLLFLDQFTSHSYLDFPSLWSILPSTLLSTINR